MPNPPRPLTPEVSARHRLGAELRRLREHARLSPAQLGALVHYSGDTIMKVEKAQRRPKPGLIDALDEALATSGALGRLLVDVEAERLAQRLRESEERGTTVPERSAYLESVDLIRRIQASDVGPATLDGLEDLVQHVGRRYLHTPLPRVHDELRQARRYSLQLLDGPHTLAERRRLYAILGWFSALLGLTEMDLGDYDVAASHNTAALRLAEESGAHELAAWAHGTQAMLALFTGDPARAVHLAEAGRAAGGTDSVFTARAIAQSARAWARLGDAARAERALEDAGDIIDGLQDSPGTGVLSFQPPYLPFYAGTAWMWLDQPRRAEVNARAAIQACDQAADDWPVARVCARFDLGVALARQGAVDEACAVGAEALALVVDRPTVPTRQRAREYGVALLPYRQVAAVQDVQERLALLPSTRARS